MVCISVQFLYLWLIPQCHPEKEKFELNLLEGDDSKVEGKKTKFRFFVTFEAQKYQTDEGAHGYQKNNSNP